MTVSYGLGFDAHYGDADHTRADRRLAVRCLARAAGTALRDVVVGVAVQVTPGGVVTELAEEVDALVHAVAHEGGSVPSSYLDYLDGFVICVPGAPTEAPVYLPDGSDLHVSPVAELRDRLDELLARSGLDDDAQDLHRALRRLCDLSEQLGVPLVVGR